MEKVLRSGSFERGEGSEIMIFIENFRGETQKALLALQERTFMSYIYSNDLPVDTRASDRRTATLTFIFIWFALCI
jgi:hypothetical protein